MRVAPGCVCLVGALRGLRQLGLTWQCLLRQQLGCTAALQLCQMCLVAEAPAVPDVEDACGQGASFKQATPAVCARTHFKQATPALDLPAGPDASFGLASWARCQLVPALDLPAGPSFGFAS